MIPLKIRRHARHDSSDYLSPKGNRAVLGMGGGIQRKDARARRRKETVGERDVEKPWTIAPFPSLPFLSFPFLSFLSFASLHLRVLALNLSPFVS